MDKIRFMWDLINLITLNECAGFGNKRLKRFIETQHVLQAEFDSKACSTDRKHRKESYTDLDTGIFLFIKAAESRGIDWGDILGVDVEVYDNDTK